MSVFVWVYVCVWCAWTPEAGVICLPLFTPLDGFCDKVFALNAELTHWLDWLANQLPESARVVAEEP